MSAQESRIINKDGSFNVERRGLPLIRSLNIYHELITMSWRKFNFLVVSAYILVNAVYAFIYVFLGMDGMHNSIGQTFWQKFSEAFFFSVQTLSTVGYGHISPLALDVNMAAAIEAFTGLLGFALVTGLLYGRFSRPVAHILFSDKAIIAPYRGITAFEFRMANEKNNQLVDVEAEVSIALIQIENDKPIRRFYSLNLELKKITFFAASWTVVHPIDDKSPIKDFTDEQLKATDAEFLILIRGFDETFSQSVHTRYSYKYSEVLWNKRFSNIFGANGNGVSYIELDKIGAIENA